MCRVCVCVGLGGRASELQRTSGGHRIKCALRNRSLCLLQQQQQQHGGKVRACLLHACLLLLWQQAGGSGTARISTRPPLTAASQQDTPIHTHNTTQHRPNRAWRGAFEWRCAPVVCPRHDYYHYMWPVIGTSEALLEREPNAHTHTHTHTHARRESCGGGGGGVRVCRQQEPRLCIERENIDRQISIDVCLCVMWSIYIYIYM